MDDIPIILINAQTVSSSRRGLKNPSCPWLGRVKVQASRREADSRPRHHGGQVPGKKAAPDFSDCFSKG